MIIKSYYIEALKNTNAKYEIDLLKVYDEDNNYHYVLVKNKSRLLNCQSNTNTKQKHYCHHCLNPFQSEKAYKNHLEKGCLASEGQQTKMPDKDTYIEFEKHNTKLPCPFVIYGDFECLTTNSNTEIKGTYGTVALEAVLPEELTKNINLAVIC